MSETDSFDWLPALLVLQGVLAAADSLFDPQGYKRLRDLVYAALFLGFAWLAPQGAFAWIVAALLAGAIALALAEPTVVLPPAQRALHAALMLNLGACAALLVPALVAWAANPTELAPAHHGWMTWALTAAAFALLAHALFARVGPQSG